MSFSPGLTDKKARHGVPAGRRHGRHMPHGARPSALPCRLQGCWPPRPAVPPWMTPAQTLWPGAALCGSRWWLRSRWLLLIADAAGIPRDLTQLPSAALASPRCQLRQHWLRPSAAAAGTPHGRQLPPGAVQSIHCCQLPQCRPQPPAAAAGITFSPDLQPGAAL